ncbi:hypothetical protein D3C81_1615860 [compost metagenome]
MHLAIIEQVVRQAEIRQRNEQEEPATALGEQQGFAAPRGKTQEQREGDQKTQAGSGQRRHAFDGDLDPQPGRAPAQADNQKQHAGDQSSQPAAGVSLRGIDGDGGGHARAPWCDGN